MSVSARRDGGAPIAGAAVRWGLAGSRCRRATLPAITSRYASLPVHSCQLSTVLEHRGEARGRDAGRDEWRGQQGDERVLGFRARGEAGRLGRHARVTSIRQFSQARCSLGQAQDGGWVLRRGRDTRLRATGHPPVRAVRVPSSPGAARSTAVSRSQTMAASSSLGSCPAGQVTHGTRRQGTLGDLRPVPAAARPPPAPPGERATVRDLSRPALLPTGRRVYGVSRPPVSPEPSQKEVRAGISGSSGTPDTCRADHRPVAAHHVFHASGVTVCRLDRRGQAQQFRPARDAAAGGEQRPRPAQQGSDGVPVPAAAGAAPGRSGRRTRRIRVSAASSIALRDRSDGFLGGSPRRLRRGPWPASLRQ